MADEYVLLFLVAALYLFDCGRWWRCDAVVFRAWTGRNFRPTLPGAQFGNDSGGFVWGNPLPPLGTMVGCYGWPVSLSPEGIYGIVRQRFPQCGSAPATRALFEWDWIGELA